MSASAMQQMFEAAVRHHHAGRLGEAEPLYRQVLGGQPDHADALQMLGVLAHQAGRHDEALELLHRAISLNPGAAAYHGNLGLVLANMGRLAEAVASYRQAISLSPDFAQAWVNLANALARQDQIDESIAAYRQAILLRSDDAESLNNLGSLYRRKGQLTEAAASYQGALALRPDFAEGYYNLANTLKEQGLLDNAIAAYRKALRLRPDFADAFNNLGNALLDAGRTEEAIAAYSQAASLAPQNAEPRCNLANALADAEKPDQAIAAYRAAIALRPNYAGAHSNLGRVLKDTGRLDEAMDCYRRAIGVDPNSPAADNLLFATYLHPDYGPEQIYREHARWSESRAAAPLAASIRSHENPVEPDRKLRIGYVSPDFANHVVGLNLLPLFREHDHGKFEVYCYSNVPHPDALTQQFQQYADAWRDVRQMGDDQASEMIRADRIDVLVDLALHSAHNRLPIFARKPAPVQVTFAGYPGTTGLRTIDYRLTDPYLDPPRMNDAFYSETSVRLPNSFWCYEASSEQPGVGPLPALSNPFVTFGCLNRFCKINVPVLKLWARVMNSFAASRLLLLCTPGSHRQRALDVLAGEGIAPQRVEFIGLQTRGQYLRTYHRIDIGLDTFPYNGHTTSLDSFWMGVPVVTLIGRTAAGRAGWSQLSNLGLQNLGSENQDGFVQVATSLAGDLARLAELRSTLRQRMRQSPLMDAQDFARGIEAAYRQMWRNWWEST